MQFVLALTLGLGLSLFVVTASEDVLGRKVRGARPTYQCYQEPDPGLCYARIPRYAFRARKGVCEEFVYGGCKGNTNNFKTMKECLENCGS